MSDLTNQADTQSGQGPQAIPLVLNAQYLKDLSFENPNAPHSLMANSGPPQVQVNVDVNMTDWRAMSADTYEVVLHIRAEAKHAERTAFMVECSYAGLFTLSGLPEEVQRQILMIEGPRLIFPFARAVVADATRDGGFPPLMINLIDFHQMYQQYAANAAAQGKGATVN